MVNAEKQPTKNPEFDREAFRDEIRQKIRASIEQPMEEWLLLMDFFEGKWTPPDNNIHITELSDEKINEFYSVLLEEVQRVAKEKKIHLSDDLENLANNILTDEGQNTIDHEKSHINEAVSRGVLLKNCALELFFTTSGFGLRFNHQFIPPENTEPLTMAYVALVPEHPSSSDLEVFKKQIRENRQYFVAHPEDFSRLKEIYQKKTSKYFKDMESFF